MKAKVCSKLVFSYTSCSSKECKENFMSKHVVDNKIVNNFFKLKSSNKGNVH